MSHDDSPGYDHNEQLLSIAVSDDIPAREQTETHTVSMLDSQLVSVTPVM